MHLVIVVVLLLCGLSNVYSAPAPSPFELPWSPFIHYGEPQLQNYDYVGPALVGEMVNPRVIRNPSPGAIDLVTNGVSAGISFFDNLVPPVYESAVRPIDPHAVDTLKNFTRPRRHENATTQFPSSESVETIELITTTITPTTESVAIVTPITPSTMIVMQDKMDVVPQVATPRADTSELELMIKQLNNALVYIQKHGNEKVHEEISNTTSTEKLVQYVSSQVEVLSKNKNIEGRPQKIKQISKALDILLNRIAKSAKPLIPAKPIGEEVNKPDPLLMARIVQHVAELKKNAISDKLNNAYELTSAELDGGLRAQFRPVRQDDDENSIDDDDKDNDVSKDVEQIPTKPVEATTTVKPNEVTARQEESSEQQSSSQEGGGNLVANLLSSFLGSLSKPNGAVDVDAIVALVSGLSVQKDDGTFDFGGLTDLLQSFLGGDENGEGGSDVGAFLGGLLGAILQGSANPPGPKGTGRLTGNLVANILPGLSGPPPPSSSEEAAGGAMQQGKPIDSGSFLAGLLTSMLGASSGTSSGSQPMNGADNHKMGSAGFFMKLKQELFKTIFGLITSILGASSGGVSQASGASSGASSQKFGSKH